MKSKPTHKPDCEFWAKATEKGFIIENLFNRDKFREFLKKHKDEWVKNELYLKNRPKTEEALGMYWANVLPSIIAHDKGLLHMGALKNNPFLLKDLIKEGKIKRDEMDSLHRDIMFTFRPDMAKDLKTKKTYRVGQLLREKDNTFLIELITEVMVYYEEQGYEFCEAEEYKKFRDSVRLLKDEGIN